jgi:peptidase E
MPKLYLIGGENVHHRSAQHINAEAFADAGGHPNVLVVPWANAGFDHNYQKRKLLTGYFRSLGAEKVDFAEYDQFEGITTKLSEADLVYLTGGQTSALIERMKKMELDGRLRRYRGVIVGRSAGALALCKKSLTTCRYNLKTKIVEGLGLVEIAMKAHYLSSKDEVLKRFSLKEEVFAVPSKSAIVSENSDLSAIGTVYVFKNGERQMFTNRSLVKTP